jgi:hypothetical protein
MNKSFSNFLKTISVDLKETPRGVLMEDTPKNAVYFNPSYVMKFNEG